MEFVLAMKKDEILPFSGWRTQLEMIRLSELIQSQKNKCHTCILSSVVHRCFIDA